MEEKGRGEEGWGVVRVSDPGSASESVQNLLKVFFLLTLSTIFTRHSLITNNSCSIKSV